MITFLNFALPVIVEGKESYVLYVKEDQMWENDVYACVHCDTGIVRHYNTSQIIVHKNATYGIGKEKTSTDNP